MKSVELIILAYLTLSFGNFKNDTLIIRNTLDANGYFLKSVSECINGDAYTIEKITSIDFQNISILSDSIWNLNSITSLSIINSNVHLSNKIKNLNGLQEILLLYDTLSEIPQEIGALKNLETLHIENCNLSMIPDTIFSLGKLKTLDLTNNKLMKISEKIGNLTSLVDLRLTSNHILEIPNTISALSKLQTLLISNNQLTTLPSAIAENKEFLTTLWVDNNQLTSLPENIEILHLPTSSMHRGPKNYLLL